MDNLISCCGSLLCDCGSLYVLKCGDVRLWVWARVLKYTCKTVNLQRKFLFRKMCAPCIQVRAKILARSQFRILISNSSQHTVPGSKSLQRSPAVGDFMEQELRFGPDLGQLALLKKNWTIYKQLLRPVFSCFHGQKKNRNILVSALKSCVK